MSAAGAAAGSTGAAAGFAAPTWPYNRRCLLRLNATNDNTVTTRQDRETQLKQFSFCLDRTLPPQLQCFLRKRMTNAGKYLHPTLYRNIFYVEKRRFDQRYRANRLAKAGITSVVLFMCQVQPKKQLQRTLNPYVWCAHALKVLNVRGARYRMIICNADATEKSLQATAQEVHADISGVPIELRDNIRSFNSVQHVLRGLRPHERISLAYISCHGDENSFLLGSWYNSENTHEELKRADMHTLCRLLRAKRAQDMQVYCNMCFSNAKAAPYIASGIPGTIVIGADKSIPTDAVIHAFEIDAKHNRFTFP